MQSQILNADIKSDDKNISKHVANNNFLGLATQRLRIGFSRASTRVYIFVRLWKGQDNIKTGYQ